MKRSDQLKQQIEGLITDCETLTQRCMAENREMTAAENQQFNTKMAESKRLQEDYAAAKQTDNNLSLMRATRVGLDTPNPVYNQNGGAFIGGGPQVRTNKLSAFKGNGNPQQAERDAYDCGLALKAVVFRDSAARDKLIARRGEAFYASMNENNPVDGGYLVAPEFSTAVFTAWEQTGAIQALAKRVPMKSDSLTFEKQTAGTTVYYPGEEGEITPSDLDIGRVSLIPKKRAILSYLSNELNDDAIVPVTDMLATDMGHQFGLKQDQEGILGDATGTYGGVHGIKAKLTIATAGISTAATGHDTWAEIDLSDLAAVMSLVPDKFRVQGELAWLCSAAFKYQVFDRLALNAGGALATQLIDGVPQMYFNGVPTC